VISAINSLRPSKEKKGKRGRGAQHKEERNYQPPNRYLLEVDAIRKERRRKKRGRCDESAAEKISSRRGIKEDPEMDLYFLHRAAEEGEKEREERLLSKEPEREGKVVRCESFFVSAD